MDSNDCGFIFMPWRLAAAPENCRRPQPAPSRLHAQQKESLTLVTNRNSVAELVALLGFHSGAAILFPRVPSTAPALMILFGKSEPNMPVDARSAATAFPS